MANATQGKFWLLDSTGIVVDTPVFVQSILVTWKNGSAGTLELTEVDRNGGVGATFMYGATLGATSAVVDWLTQSFPINNWVKGINVKTITDVAKVIVNIK